MMRRRKTKFIHEGHYVAEVEVELLEDEGGWSPYLSLDGALRLDSLRKALRQGDLTSAARYGRISELRPVASR